MVGEVFLGAFAVGALVEPAAELGGAAREDAAHGPVVGGVYAAAMSAGVCGPVLTQDVCEGEWHGLT